ncbi:MAG: hypothetical protein Q4B42_02355 [Oscillospiraceae bacterium]|nr:hypothetical protein [Oscillospiraceae bacterium]
MKSSKRKSALAVAVCLVIMAAIIAAPRLVAAADEAAMLGGEYRGERAARDGALSAAGIANAAARALYIDRAYVFASGGGRSASEGGLTQLEELKAAGIVPRSCTALSRVSPPAENACRMELEPVSGLLVSVSWGGEGVSAETLIERFAAYLGLADIEDWRHIEYRGPNMSGTSLGRYSPSLQLYISLQADDKGLANGIEIHSYTAVEMEPLLALTTPR